MEIVKIIVLCTVAACFYGVVQDQVTVRVCPEYFTIGHPPVFETGSLTLLALGWGVIATWWVGLPLGTMVALGSRVGQMPRPRAVELLRPLSVLLICTGAIALLAGIAGYQAAQMGIVWLVEPLASRIVADRHPLYLADLWAHLAAYAAGAIGGIGLCIWCVVVRARRWSPAAAQPPIQG